MWVRIYNDGLRLLGIMQCQRCGLQLHEHQWAEFCEQGQVLRCSVKDKPTESKSVHRPQESATPGIPIDVAPILEAHARQRAQTGYHNTYPYTADYSAANIREGQG